MMIWILALALLVQCENEIDYEALQIAREFFAVITMPYELSSQDVSQQKRYEALIGLANDGGLWDFKIIRENISDQKDEYAFSAKATRFDGTKISIIAFPGTQSAADAKKDAESIIMAPWKIAGIVEDVAEGLLTKYGVYEQFLNATMSDVLASDVEEIYVVGHSLGGAVSAFCTLEIIDKSDRGVQGYSLNGRPVTLVSVGAPRALEQDYADKVHKMFASKDNPHRVYRFVNYGDIVPSLPPAISGFKHFGRAFHLNNQGDIFCNSVYTLKEKDQDYSPWSAVGLSHDGITHMMGEYLQRMVSLTKEAGLPSLAKHHSECEFLPRLTEGQCRALSCDASRGLTECIHGNCFCKNGTYSANQETCIPCPAKWDVANFDFEQYKSNYTTGFWSVNDGCKRTIGWTMIVGICLGSCCGLCLLSIAINIYVHKIAGDEVDDLTPDLEAAHRKMEVLDLDMSASSTTGTASIAVE